MKLATNSLKMGKIEIKDGDEGQSDQKSVSIKIMKIENTNNSIKKMEKINLIEIKTENTNKVLKLKETSDLNNDKKQENEINNQNRERDYLNNNLENIDMTDFGWHEGLETQREAFFKREKIEATKALHGRILLDYGQQLKVITIEGEKWFNRPSQKDLQLAVGDWVLVQKDDYQVDEAHFLVLLDRKTKFSRMAAGVEVKEQIIATNVDVVFLIQSLNNDFNPRRLERYLIATWESGAQPVVVLTKSDLCDDYAEKIRIVNDVAFGVDVHAISSLTGEGLETIKPYFKKGRTIALLGSSGVGKSTLVNTMVGSEILETKAVREEDSKGRHTTTHRELVLLPEGGLILDTPGMRSLALWDAEEGMSQMFGDVEALLSQCRFNNCSHKKELGCAIQTALKSGELKKAHWESWIKLQNEQRHLESKINQKTRALNKANSLHKIKKETKRVVVRRASEEY